jgi:hypothetical protein
MNIYVFSQGKKSVVETWSNLGLILEHITSLTEVRFISIYRYCWVIFGFPAICNSLNLLTLINNMSLNTQLFRELKGAECNG